MSKRKKNNSSIHQVLTQMVLDIFEQNGNTPLNYKQVSAKLNVRDPESREIIYDILKDEVKKSVLKEIAPGKFQLLELKTFIEGVVDLTNDGSAFIVTDDEFESDIFIAPRKLRTALNGDRVKVYVYAKSKGKHKEGEVIEILQRAKMEFTGIVKLSERYAFFIPDDRKMMHDIFIPISELNGAKNGIKAVAEITDWPTEAKNPIGRIKHILGAQGENDTEMNAILAEYGFPLSFPAEVEHDAEEIPDVITPEEIAKRRDFRNITTFTIDPFDAKDFDDALSYRVLHNGNYEVGVHIADVSHYITPDSALDKEALDRATSVYLVDRVIPMLPERLSNGLCSLRPKEEKLCFSAVFEMDENANIITEWYGKTIIYSDRRFTYEEVQEVIETGKGDFKEEIFKLNALAYKLRDRKFKNGAISFETTEVKFKLDENGKPTGVYVKERKDAHKLIEDFMLLANRKVAERVSKMGKGKHKYTFVYRVHDSPKPDALANFAQFAARFGYKINTKSDKETAKSLNYLMEDVEGKKEQNVLTHLAIRSMAKAIYTTKSSSHYGLAFDHYTHFTSPIRRYPDVMVHRLLFHYLSGGQSANAEFYEKLCSHSSLMEKKAADAERSSVKYKQAEYLRDQVGNTFMGIISGVTEWGMYVEIIENKCEGMIRLRDISDDFYTLDEKNYAIIGQRKKKIYQLGDEVKIKVKQVDLTKKQIDFILVQE
ncbi:ribonuclease R [Mucilaginibacter rubeus]|uniref:Ribonuclease R n=1 Tax=Mucilaginibacter rubeus TaxID=2027860 RepID=A0AAE6MIL4_9SPHI|nr:MULTISPECIES: ribonuclease R [Mucilaginibacter]QEM04297.1 ribonuclease R [Mucilaginibacter rubeus]QEM16896.1 ribonuclease R [Mucilaginibacter gossypii]QTE46617.1 ribonuclease R [Mucilaginibacter rubeus]QTE53214.1 ribonuclease R [Mucilaginibacter rubeus]QTE58302.1 ribonuclease R [Mucilaginibacter rubeus]